MKTISRIISFILAAVTGTAMLAACAKPNDNTVVTTSPVGTAESAETTVPAETADPNYLLELPGGLNYNGTTVSILVEGQSFAADEFNTSGTNGEVVNDAVYTRNTAVEDLLGVKLKFTLASSSDVYAVGNTIRTSVSSGDKSYAVTTMPGYTHTTYILEGNYYNLHNIDNLNLDKYYWTQGFNEIMSNGEKQYVTSGAYSLSMYRNMYVTLYNKDIFTANGLEDLYDIVLNAQWTILRQGEIAKNIYGDLNGNGQRDALDSYGFVSGAVCSTDPYWVSLGMQFLTSAGGTYVFEPNTEKMIDCVDKIQSILFKNQGAYSVGSTSTEDGAYNTNIIKIFSENRAAMCTTIVYQLESFLTPSGFEGSYGIAPMPKYDEAQENYHTHIQDQLSVMSVVATVPENELPMIGAVMEAISAYSYEYVYNAYYKTALSYKYLQNEQSVIMLDLIYRSIRIEGAFIYSAKYAMLGKMRAVISSGSNTMASAYKVYKKVWEEGTRTLNEGLDKLEH